MTGRCVGVVLLALVLPMLLTACDEEEPKAPPQDGAQDEEKSPDSDLPTLVVQASPHPHAERMLQEMFEAQTPTKELMAGWPGGADPETVYLVDRLRRSALWQLNRGWMSEPEDGWWWAADRACDPEALVAKRVLRVDVTVLALPEAKAKEWGAKEDLVPLAKPVEELLEASAREGYARATYGPVALRAGETGRLTAGWTRARRHAYQEGDQIESNVVGDVFSGLRIGVTALRTEDKGPWNLAVFASLSRLEGDADVEVEVMKRLGSNLGGEGEGGGGEEKGEMKSLAQAYRTLTALRLPENNTVSVIEEPMCWIMSMRSDSQAKPIYVLIRAELEDLE